MQIFISNDLWGYLGNSLLTRSHPGFKEKSSVKLWKIQMVYMFKKTPTTNQTTYFPVPKLKKTTDCLIISVFIS